jgi:hypothetical protein
MKPIMTQMLLIELLMLRSDPALIENLDANLQRKETKAGTYVFSHLLAMR